MAFRSSAFLTTVAKNAHPVCRMWSQESTINGLIWAGRGEGPTRS